LAAGVVGSDEDASVALEQAGRRSLDRSAYATSSMAFERAARLTVALPRRAHMLLSSAEAAWHAGLGARTRELLEQAREAAGDEEVRLRIDDLAGRVSTRQGPILDGYEILVEAAQRAQAGHAVSMLAEAAAAAFYLGDAARMVSAGQRALSRITPGASAETEFLAQAAHGMAQIFGGDAAEGAASVRLAVELASGLPNLSRDPRLLPWVIVTTLFLRESAAGRDLLDSTMRQARERAALDVLAFVLNLVGRDQATSDRWKEAEATYLEAAALSRETGQLTQLALALGGLTWLYARLGWEERMRAAAEEAEGIGRQLGTRLVDAWVLAGFADLELGRGRLTEALEKLEERQQLLDELGITDPDLSPGPELVEVLTRLGRESEAGLLAARVSSEALAKGQPWSLARAARARGLLASEDDMAGEFEHAIDLHLQTVDQFELARTQLVFGERLRRARARREARPMLRAALDVFERLEAEPWAERARSELAASGETLMRRDPSSLDELTPQELQIALLLASGSTTREAAAALFISPKTVEYHLRHVYLKLGVHSRDELAAAMAEPAAARPSPAGAATPAG
jgi:DNA-binding CsgD family transcriptional regulator